MGEEEQSKAEQPKKSAENDEKNAKKKETQDDAEKTSDDSPPPPPPPEIVFRVHMHCEGCARKIQRALKGFPGVEEVKTDCKNSRVVVKGEKADPLKVLERIQKKVHGHRKVELISPLPPPPPPPPEEEKINKPDEKEAPKDAEKKEELSQITVVLGVYMHCEACAQEIKKRILRMKGVESVEPDLKESKVTVKGVFTPENLVDCVYRRTLKHATIISVEPEKKKDENPKESKEEEEKKPEDPPKEDKPGDDVAPPEKGGVGGGETEEPKIDLRKNEFHYLFPNNFQIYPQIFVHGEHSYGQFYPPPPAMFSDENPNACSVM